MAGRGGRLCKKKSRGVERFLHCILFKEYKFLKFCTRKKERKNYKNLFKDGEHFFKQSSGERTEQA